MDVERLTYIAEWLEAGAPHKGKVKGFDISVGVQAHRGDTPDCGTVCCIAGAATQFFNDEDGKIADQARIPLGFDTVGEAAWDDVFREGQELLGLTFEQAQQLFVPVGVEHTNGIFAYSDQWGEYNDPKLAAKVIRNLIATGEVNWDIEE